MTDFQELDHGFSVDAQTRLTQEFADASSRQLGSIQSLNAKPSAQQQFHQHQHPLHMQSPTPIRPACYRTILQHPVRDGHRGLPQQERSVPVSETAGWRQSPRSQDLLLVTNDFPQQTLQTRSMLDNYLMLQRQQCQVDPRSTNHIFTSTLQQECPQQIYHSPQQSPATFSLSTHDHFPQTQSSSWFDTFFPQTHQHQSPLPHPPTSLPLPQDDQGCSSEQEQCRRAKQCFLQPYHGQKARYDLARVPSLLPAQHYPNTPATLHDYPTVDPPWDNSSLAWLDSLDLSDFDIPTVDQPFVTGLGMADSDAAQSPCSTLRVAVPGLCMPDNLAADAFQLSIPQIEDRKDSTVAAPSPAAEMFKSAAVSASARRQSGELYLSRSKDMIRRTSDGGFVGVPTPAEKPDDVKVEKYQGLPTAPPPQHRSADEQASMLARLFDLHPKQDPVTVDTGRAQIEHPLPKRKKQPSPPSSREKSPNPGRADVLRTLQDEFTPKGLSIPNPAPRLPPPPARRVVQDPKPAWNYPWPQQPPPTPRRRNVTERNDRRVSPARTPAPTRTPSVPSTLAPPANPWAPKRKDILNSRTDNAANHLVENVAKRVRLEGQYLGQEWAFSTGDKAPEYHFGSQASDCVTCQRSGIQDAKVQQQRHDRFQC